MIGRRLGLGGNNRVASVIAVAGVGCALFVMMLTVSVAGGFKDAIRGKLSGFDADITVQPPYNYTYGEQSPFMDVTPEIAEAVASVTPDARTSAVLRQPGMLKTDDDYAVLVFTGYGSGHDFGFERNNLTAGVWPDYVSGGGDSIVVSDAVASRLAISPGDRVNAVFFAGDNIRARKFTVAGLYSSNFGDYDRTVCYAPLRALQKVCGLGVTGATAFEIRGVDPDSIADKARQLQECFLSRARLAQADSVPVVDNITHSGSMYLSWLDLLDTNVVVIFALMCCVAAITLISSLFILILNNVSTIGLLRSLGASKRQVRSVFVALAMRLVGLGMIVGDVLALTVIWIENTWSVLPLDPDSYYLDHVPMQFYWIAFVTINIGVAVMAWLVLVLPARVASSVSPARSMRYE